MGKHKKTRKEKIIADYRHQVYTLENTNISSSEPITNSEKAYKNSNSYSYVLGDVSKTGMLTFSVIGFELILFFLLKNHILKIPGIVY